MTDSIREYTMAPGFEPIGQYIRGNDAITGVQWGGDTMVIGFKCGYSMHIKSISGCDDIWHIMLHGLHSPARIRDIGRFIRGVDGNAFDEGKV